jgi:hypothetical protein
MLKANLERLGVDLVFENQLGDNNLFLEVNSQRIVAHYQTPNLAGSIHYDLQFE